MNAHAFQGIHSSELNGFFFFYQKSKQSLIQLALNFVPIFPSIQPWTSLSPTSLTQALCSHLSASQFSTISISVIPKIHYHLLEKMGSETWPKLNFIELWIRSIQFILENLDKWLSAVLCKLHKMKNYNNKEAFIPKL